MKKALRRYRQNVQAVKQGQPVILGICIWLFMQLTFGIVFWELGSTCKESDKGWAYSAAVLSLEVLFILIRSVFIIREQVFERKDNELLLSMPISYWQIVKKRICSVFIKNKGISSMILCPALIAGIKLGVLSGCVQVLHVLVLINLVQVLILVSLTFAYGILYFFIKGKTFHVFLLLFMFFGIAGYFKLFVQVQELLKADSMGQLQGKWLDKLLFQTGSAVTQNNVLPDVMTLCILLVLLTGLKYFINAYYLRIVLDCEDEKILRKVSWKRKSPFCALLEKHLFYYITDTRNYLRAGGVTIIMLVFSVMQSGQKGQLMSVFNGLDETTAFLAVCTMIWAYNVMMGYSADLLESENGYLWMDKSFPLTSSQIRWSCVLLHNIMALPFNVILSVAVGVFHVRLLELFIFATMEFSLLISLLGVAFYVYRHKKSTKMPVSSTFLTKEYGFIAEFILIGIMTVLSSRCGMSEMEIMAAAAVILMIINGLFIYKLMR